MSSIFITSHLIVGTPPTDLDGHVVEVKNAHDAHLVIEAGGTAVLPPDAWELAEETLRSFGASEEHIRYQVGTARHPSGNATIPAHP